jgi:superfamily II DNA or RNA helicase
LPTAAGKTQVATTMAGSAKRAGLRVWFIVHRRELVQQTCAALRRKRVAHGIIASGYPTDPEALVQVCSVGTLQNKLRLLSKPHFVIWDECHHVAAQSWSSIMRYLRQAKHLGLSATPERLDGKGLDQWFDQLCLGPDELDLIDQGYLSGFRYFAPTIPDLQGVGIINREYRRNELAASMDRVLVGDVVAHRERHAKGKRTLAFCVSVRASKKLVRKFNRSGVPAAHVDAKTPLTERDRLILALETGEIKVLSNVEVFTEGFDLPAIGAVILMRPTLSRALYRQMVGRGLRVSEGKAKTVILDHAACVGEHGLPDHPIEWSLRGRRDFNRGASERLRRCPGCSAVHQFSAACPECDYVYGHGDRSLREVSGALRRIKSSAAGGYETIDEFAKRIGRGRGAVSRYIREFGMPCGNNGTVPIEASLKWVATYREKTKAMRSTLIAQMWTRPGHRENVSGKISSAMSNNQKAKEARRKQLADPEYKLRHKQGLLRRWADPEEVAKHSKRMKAMHSDPVHKAKHKAGVRKYRSGAGN